MRLMFLTLLDFDTFSERNIYTDLLREFIKNGHDVYCISPVERRREVKTHFEENGHLLKLRIGNTQKTNIVEKGISTLLIEPMFKSALKKYFSDIKFDLVLYSTPPITFKSSVEFIKKRDGAKSYLMLKDIFPQNAVDLGMISKNGLKGLLYKHFRKKEKALYAVSDRIGCMSQANADYILRHNPEVSSDKIEICPNCIEVQNACFTKQTRPEIRDKYGIPRNKKVFVYGGNLGRPQNVPFIVSCLKACAVLDDVYFVIAGNGTDRYILENYIRNDAPRHVKLLNQLSKEEYEHMVKCCDVGLIFLDHRFTIPNFPSRLLSYMQAELPVLACTDLSTDVGKIITEAGFGKWCESNSIETFVSMVTFFCQNDTDTMGKHGYKFLVNNYNVETIYKKIF